MLNLQFSNSKDESDEFALNERSKKTKLWQKSTFGNISEGISNPLNVIQTPGFTHKKLLGNKPTM
jgi:hypothetical protein